MKTIQLFWILSIMVLLMGPLKQEIVILQFTKLHGVKISSLGQLKGDLQATF